MLRKIRIAAAALFFACITLMLLDFTGTLHAWLGWMAKIQFLPAALALNFGIVAALLALTLLFGRIYCSTICPLGVFQDVVSNIAARKNRRRFSFSKAKTWLRLSVLALVIVGIAAGVSVLVSFFAPYSTYGRIVANLFQPLYIWGNNLLALISEHFESYAFYSADVWIKSLPTFIIAAVMLVLVVVLAWKNGRTWCNTICPVGTVLGLVSKFSLFKPVIDESKCVNCGACGKQCKASCIDTKNHKIDYSRCVDCFDCLENCKVKAIKYKATWKKADKPAGQAAEQTADVGRRAFLTGAALVAGTATLGAQEEIADGGLADILEKKAPNRATPLKPAGSLGLRNFTRHCSACQLCVAQCPNGVLRPSANLMTLMQPEMSFERGYCRPECTKCSQVCPAGAIRPIGVEDKTAIHIGHAVLIPENCIPRTDGVECGNCARHCPVDAIRMVRLDPDDPNSLMVPSVNEERCIGCGACENLCPARPVSAIYVEGHETHRID